MERGISLLGLLGWVAIAYGCSVNRRAIRWQPLLWGLALQLLLGLLILRTPWGLQLFQLLGDGVTQFLDFADAGARFVFGEKFKDFFVAFKILPTILFFSAVISLLYHYGVLQRVVGLLARGMVRVMGTSGSESLSAAANIFVGPTEAPLLIKPYVVSMTQSELFAVMTGGFATIAGGVMAAYISFGIPAQYLIAASVMSAPAALAIAKVMWPETEESLTRGRVSLSVERTTRNGIDAITQGTLEGLQLALNVGAMLIVFIALVAMVNGGLAAVGSWVGLSQLSLELVLGYAMAPVAWLLGVPMQDCVAVGALLGKRTILNEFVAYLDLKALMESGQITERSVAIATYALCGFANIGTIGITIGGMSTIAPERRGDLAGKGVLAMLAGTLACLMTAAIAGLLI